MTAGNAKLRYKTRDPRFLWSLGVMILSLGLIAGFAVHWLPPTVMESLHAADSAAYSAHLDRLERAAEAGNWSTVWWGIPHSMWIGAMVGPALIAGFTGLCWFVFLVQAGQPGSDGGIRWPLAIAAVPLGVLSIWPTLFLIYFQEQQWNLHESTELAAGFRFYIAGVGLREEVSKLLLFLPLVPAIIRGGSEREALLIGGLVGLGFAMEENIGYFTSSPTSTVDRFLLSSFLHISLTGLAGLALCRMIWWPQQCWQESIGIILLAIVLHGVFDALLVLPAIAEYNILSFIIYILLAYRFFHELRAWWRPRGEPISLTATFVTAVSLITAVAFVYFAALTDFSTALTGITTPAISSGIFVYMFLREMPESLID